ncbi:MAG: AAA family ATPase [Magnetococcales bacterium]|nr:AAA family ATPase [Magnetococcales bacterium]
MPLTERQNQILHLVQLGQSNKEVARALNISEGTVKQHLLEIYRRLNVTNRTMAAEAGRRAEIDSLFLPRVDDTELGRATRKSSRLAPALTFPRFTAAMQSVTILKVEIRSSETLVNSLGSHGFARFHHLFREVCHEEAHRFSGVVQGLPDGLLLLFGVPHTREDDPERAACCATRIFGRMRDIASGEWGHLALPIRICLITGELVVNTDRDKTTLHGAMLLQSCGTGEGELAPVENQGPGMDGATREALEILAGRYGLLPLPLPVEMGNIPIWPPLPFVGRKTELPLMHEYLARMLKGNSRAVLLLGEAGFGKTRLVERLREECPANRAVRWLIGVCRPAGRQFPLHPFLSILEGLAGVETATLPLVTRQKQLRQWIMTLGEPWSRLGLALLEWHGNNDGLSKKDTEGNRLVDAAEFLAAVVQRNPQHTVLFLDNLQWADSATLALLPMLVQRFHGSPVWLLGAGRKAELRPMVAQTGMEPVALPKMTTVVLMDLMRSLLLERPVSEAFLLRLARWCRGVPLFAVAIARHLLLMDATEAVETMPEERLFPPSLQGLILERLHDAGIDWRTARAIAAWGRVTLNQLQKLELHADPGVTQVAVNRLVQVGVVEATGSGSGQTLTFTNGLVRGAIWHTLPEGDRKV